MIDLVSLESSFLLAHHLLDVLFELISESSEFVVTDHSPTDSLERDCQNQQSIDILLGPKENGDFGSFETRVFVLFGDSISVKELIDQLAHLQNLKEVSFQSEEKELEIHNSEVSCEGKLSECFDLFEEVEMVLGFEIEVESGRAGTRLLRGLE